MMRGLGSPLPAAKLQSRPSLATSLLLTALLLTSVFAYFQLMLYSHQGPCKEGGGGGGRGQGDREDRAMADALSSRFPWRSWGFSQDPDPDPDSDPDSDSDSDSESEAFPGFFFRRDRKLPGIGGGDGGGGYASNLTLHNLVFCIGGGQPQVWQRRKELIKLWWKPRSMRGFVWLDEEPAAASAEDAPEQLPVLRVSEDASSFKYTHPVGSPSGVRIARILLETFRLGLPDVHWFVLADDDTLFSAHNLLRVLGKYDAREMYYVGGHSESHFQNFAFSYNMAYGGAGVAVSFPLAEALVGIYDDCIQRYAYLYGSDDRLHACVTELGVPITKEPGFHQFDIQGNPLGLLVAHPVAPFVSIHHVEVIEPIFPFLGSLDSLRLLVKAMQTEPSSFLQQSICYQPNHKLSFSVSLGYSVQVYPRIMSPRELQKAERTFRAWNELDLEAEFDINTRPSPSICDQPFLFFLEEIYVDETSGRTVSTYNRHRAVDDLKKQEFCWSQLFPPDKVNKIRVSSRPLGWKWFLVPRRQCCSLGRLNNKVLDISVDSCSQGMVITT